MNICFNDFTVTGLPNSTSVIVSFENMADGSKSTASGTTDGSGNLTISSADMPDFIAGVKYKIKTDETWTLDSTVVNCAIIDFSIITDSGAVVTGASVVVVECD